MQRISRIGSILVLMLAVLLAATPAAFADYVEVKRNAHVRESATKASASLTIGTVGKRFELLDDGRRQRNFYHIALGDGRTGWIYAPLVERRAGELTAASALGVNQVSAHFIDVDQGAAALVEFPCAAVLIDAGGRNEAAVNHLISYLDDFFARRTDLDHRIATIFITHTHVDHNRGLKDVAQRFKIGGYVHNGVLEGSGKSAAGWMVNPQNAPSPAWRIRDVADAEVTAAGTRGLTDDVIDAVNCPGVDPVIRVLSGRQDDNPGWSDGEFENGNNKSLVIRVDYGQSSFLFTGDLEEPAIETLVDYYARTDMLDVDVWAVGHHGSANGVTESLMRAMTPEIAVVSMGAPTSHDPWTAYAYGHPRRSAITLIDSLLSGERVGPADQKVADKVKSFTPYHIVHGLYATGWDGDVTIRGDASGTLAVERGH
jgi:beta-lactamase superfamily II metal-dependent hydrolase